MVPRSSCWIGSSAKTSALLCGRRRTVASTTRLICPRDGRPSDKAIAAASGADALLAKARRYPDIPAAIADLVHVYAATARDRGMVRREATPRTRHPRCGPDRVGRGMRRLVGPEPTGLLNDDVALVDTVLTVPLNPGLSSLNLAQPSSSSAMSGPRQAWPCRRDFAPRRSRPAARRSPHFFAISRRS